MISKRQKENIWALYEIDNMSKSMISRKLGVSRQKVIDILKEPKYKNVQLIDTVKEMNKESNDNLVKILREDNRLASISTKILDIMNDPVQLEKEIERSGLRTLATVFGILSDKAMKALEMDKANTDDNVTVKIINNAPAEKPTIEIDKENQDEFSIN